ncbi:hypothetical protein MEO40_20165 [Dolichospermum sp. ST_sed1]|nr:hypothetical protein [Dolichospermum sp. ST_sed1]MDD1433391.1 hypothetical protein [Dolichospermum sp. ST_sed6]MDD1442747.1 hypothetical protein [Dolichospermum sp. ST_sed3]MDD1448411.1 hypothetical protein [Dolichospermum sp. ST_sed8]MDD1458423.1 hypothetical protein [Dolichospermum sp. ST_sed7]MDD1474845.1 hypothetical protein [Dolichospermum sp. ST_sed4]
MTPKSFVFPVIIFVSCYNSIRQARSPLSLESQQREVFLGRDWTTRSEYSEAIACRIDAQVGIIGILSFY